MRNARDIAIATQPRHVLFVDIGGGVPFRSLDGGSSWQMLGPPENNGIDMLASTFAGADSTRLYSATSNGLWASSDAGDTWTRAAGALGQIQTTALGYADADGNTILYAATNGGGAAASGSTLAAAPRTARAAARTLVGAGIYRYVLLPVPKLTLTLNGLKSGALKLGRSLAVRGKVTPSRFARSRVKLTVQRKKGHKWVAVKTMTRTSSAKGVYSWKYKPAKRGSYRLRATVAKTTKSAAASTKWRTFAVK